MPRRRRDEMVPVEDWVRYEEWRDRVLSWPAAIVDQPGLKLSDMRPEYQATVLKQLLRNKAARNGPRHWSQAVLDRGDL
jgi:hypothetical protein